jgi:hypothetical protein
MTVEERLHDAMSASRGSRYVRVHCEYDGTPKTLSAEIRAFDGGLQVLLRGRHVGQGMHERIPKPISVAEAAEFLRSLPSGGDPRGDQGEDGSGMKIYRSKEAEK